MGRYVVYVTNPSMKGEFKVDDAMSGTTFIELKEEVITLCEHYVYSEMYIWDTLRELEVYRRTWPDGPIYG